MNDWRGVVSSVKGALHIKKDILCQDASVFEVTDNYALISLADGHGNARYIRSLIGAQFAVNQFAMLLKNLFLEPNLNSMLLNEYIHQDLSKHFIRNWKSSILKYHLENSLEPNEIELLARLNIDIPDNELDILRIYGTTVIGIVATKFGIVFFQLGDGDILTISNNEINRVFSAHLSIIDYQTESLCQPDADLKTQTAFIYPNKTTPFIFTCTDGFSNSFVDDKSFFNTVLEYQKLVQIQSKEFIKDNLPIWLNETSEKGSGDDISVGLLWK